MTQKLKKEPSSYTSRSPISLTPKDIIQEGGLDSLSSDAKLKIARDFLEKLNRKFPLTIDRSLFKELDRIAANLEIAFINQRNASHLSKLAYAIYFIRRRLSKNITLFPFKDHCDIRIFPSSLRFTFGSKPVLSILAHAHLKDKYEALDEEQILCTIRKLIPDAQIVKGSSYDFQASKNTVKTLYFEINKKSGLLFQLEEIKRLKGLLKQEIGFSIEQLVPRVFMTRNEEEVLRNILTLSREIHQASDIPQVMILFDQQTSQEAIFTIIVIRISEDGHQSLSELFLKVEGDFSYAPERYQIVRYLEGKPIEAHVFRITLRKDPALLRTDLSLNFYLGRQRVSQILEKTIGEFRDFNGGIILKQREGLMVFMETFSDLSLQHPDLLENFFYSLSPIERQATLPIVSLKTLFSLFLEALNYNKEKNSQYFFKTHRNNEQLFLIIRTPDPNCKETIDQIFITLNLTQAKDVTSVVYTQNMYFLGYLIETPEIQIQEHFLQAVVQGLENWKQKVETRQVLTLGLEYPFVSLDPRIGGDHISTLLIKLVFEGLMRENREGKLEYGIAKSVDISSDYKTYFFHLRNTHWSNGSFVSAFDFEYAWKKILSPTFKTPFAYLFYPIKNAKLAKEGLISIEGIGVQALDDLTLRVELHSPTPYFLELTAHSIYSPVHRLIDQLHPNWILEEKESYVCNGAFQLKKNSPHESYEFIKNPLYWDAKDIKLDEIVILRTNVYQAYEMFRKNENPWIGVPLVTWDPNFVPQETDEPINFTYERMYWHAFNCQKPPFNNKKMRQAFALAINKQELAAILNARPANSPLPDRHSQVTSPSISSINLDKAKNLFQEGLLELNLTHENFPLIILIHLKGSARNIVSEFIKHQWEIIFGIKCKSESLEWNALFSRMTQGDFDLGGITWTPWVNDPMYTLNSFRNSSESINFSKWENSQYQEILCLAEKEIDLGKRQVYYMQAEKILLDELPVALVSSMKTQSFKKKNFKIHSSSTLLNLKWAYFSS